MKFNLPYVRFMNYGQKGLWFSLALTLVCLVLIFVRGFNFGLEFTGGATVEVKYPQAVSIAEIRQKIREVHPNATVVQYGSSQDIQVRFSELEGRDTNALMQDIITTLQSVDENVVVSGQSKIGGQYKEELIEKGITALVLATVGMIIYLGIRFEWKFAIGAVLAQLHDVIVTAGVFSLMQWTFDLTVLAALLAVLGYSVNDTVVVYDRIRENFLKMPAQAPKDVVDIAINQTLARTIVTGLTTLLAVLALLFFGGETLFGFAAAMIFGVIFGTYSSVLVASALVVRLGVKHEDLIPKPKEEIDDMP